MFKGLSPILYNGREVWPLIEGGKGVAATNHASAGAWAAAGGIGTVSAVNADSYDAEGKIIPQIYRALTRREREVLRLIADGLSNREVARQLEISPKTVDGHRTKLMGKLDLHKTADLVRFAIREGLVSA